jgi:hypothetical protein
MPKKYSNAVLAFAALEEACNKFGGRNKFARQLIKQGVKVTVSSVSNWKKVPIKFVKVVSELSGISHKELLPDIDWL